MTCLPPAGCGHEFCWLCLAPYDSILRDGNHRHQSTCQYYAPYDEADDSLYDDGVEMIIKSPRWYLPLVFEVPQRLLVVSDLNV